MQDVRGYNPYKFGMAGGSDSHNTGSPYRQDNFYGLHADATVRSTGALPACSRLAPWTCAGKSRRADRRVGGGEHPRLALGRDVPQGNLRRQRPAHQGALLRRVGLQQGHPERQRLGASVLRGRRADGRRPAAHARRKGRGPDVRRLGGEGPDLGQSRPHPDHQGLDQERPELREDLSTWPGPATASPTSGRAGFRRSRAPWTWRRPPTPTSSARPS